MRGEVVDEQVRGAAPDLRDAEMLVVQPLEPAGAGGTVRRLIDGIAAGCGDRPDVAAGRSLVGHESANEGDAGSVGRPAGDGDLQAVQRAGRGARVENGGRVAVQRLGIELRHPPVVLAGRRRGDVGELRGVAGPGIFVDVQVVGGDLLQLAAGSVHEGDAFDLEALDANNAGGRLFGREGAGLTGGAFNINQAEIFAVRGPGEVFGDAVQLGESARRS